jgi:hypothetical protein
MYYLGDLIKEKEMGGACSRYVAEERCMQGAVRPKQHTFRKPNINPTIKNTLLMRRA